MTVRRPTRAERRQEGAVLWTSVADTAMVAGFILVAVASQSLTLLGEAARAGLLLALHLYTLWVMFRVHRGRFAHYEFGVAKIEHLVWCILGGGFLVGAWWVTGRVFARLEAGAVETTQQGLALAAIANGVGLVVNYIGWSAMRAAARDGESGMLEAQISARLVMLQASAALQVTLTLAVLAGDPVIAQTLDVAGALLLVFLKLLRGVAMLRRAVPVLVDAPAEEALLDGLHDVAEKTLPPGALASLRARPTGRGAVAEVAVEGGAFASSAEIAAGARRIGAAAAARGLEVDIRVAVRPTEDRPA